MNKDTRLSAGSGAGWRDGELGTVARLETLPGGVRTAFSGTAMV